MIAPTLFSSISINPSIVNFHFDNDAHVDDLVAFVLLEASLGHRLRSITVGHGDSIMDSALGTYRRLLKIFGRRDITVGAGSRNIRNPFPGEWRNISREINEIDFFANAHCSRQPSEEKSSLEVLQETAQRGPIHLVATGPLTNIAEWFHRCPQDIPSIHRLIVMGGSLYAGGNVNMPESSDGAAEWNFFADPEAADSVLNSGVPLFLIPLDVAGKIPVNDTFMSQLSQLDTLHSQIAYRLWNLVYRRYDYFLWDVVAAIAAIHPEFFTFEEHRLSVDQTGRRQGRLIKTPHAPPCQVAVQLNMPAVLNKVFELLGNT